MEKTGLLPLTEEERALLLAGKPIETENSVESQPFARGKFAAVRRAFRKNDETVFAAKYIRKRRRTSPEEVWHEVSVLHKSRDCPFIVCLYKVFETPLDTILLLEMAEGGDLQTVLDTEEFLQEHVCTDILRDTLQGLKFLHNHSIAHLDIKPQNLVVTGPLPGGRVKLCDFGLSRHLSNAAEVRELLGTPEYVSPEVLNYEPLTLATDCWAVGVLTYVLLSGVSPFGGDSKQETFLNISQRALTFPSNYFQNVSAFAVDFIEKLLVIKPSERLSADECLRHIWLEGEGNSQKLTSSPQEPNNNEKNRNSNGASSTDSSQKPNGTGKESERHQVSSSGDQRGPNDDIDSGIGSEEDHRRNLSWARLDEVLENERKISSNPDWLTLEVEEDPSRNIWPNRKKKCSWEAECTGSFCIMRLPLEVSDARERLKVLNKKREKIIHSTVAAMNFTLVPLVGALPHPVLNFFAQRNATTIMMSNFPGPPVTGTFFGYPILFGSFGGGLGRGNLGFGVAMLSYRGTLSFGVGIDQALLPNNAKAEELLRFVKDEIHILEQDAVI